MLSSGRQDVNLKVKEFSTPFFQQKLTCLDSLHSEKFSHTSYVEQGILEWSHLTISKRAPEALQLASRLFFCARPSSCLPCSAQFWDRKFLDLGNQLAPQHLYNLHFSPRFTTETRAPVLSVWELPFKWGASEKEIKRIKQLPFMLWRKEENLKNHFMP